MREPLISVVVPLYNKQAYVKRAIQSVLSQVYRHFEIIVVDDGSTDESFREAEDFASDKRVRLIRQANSGEGGARNRALAEMGGEIAAFLDADDEWLPTHLDHIAELAIGFPQAGWFATGYRSVFRGGLITETTLSLPRPLLVPNYFELATGTYFVHISSAAVRKSALGSTGGFRVGEPVGADLEFYGRLALRHTLAYHPAISGVYHHQIPHSAMSTAGWWTGFERPLVVRTLDSHENEFMSPALRDSARRYADWILSEYVLAGLCAGYGRKALGLFEGRKVTNRWLMTLIAHSPFLPILGFMVRLLRSRWFVRHEKRHGQVVVRRVRPLAFHA